LSFIKGWNLLDDALDRVKVIKGSREQAGREKCEYLRTGPVQLPGKYWRENGKWEDAEPSTARWKIYARCDQSTASFKVTSAICIT
jgi:hypothetical protein